MKMFLLFDFLRKMMLWPENAGYGASLETRQVLSDAFQNREELRDVDEAAEFAVDAGR